MRELCEEMLTEINASNPSSVTETYVFLMGEEEEKMRQ